MQALKRRIAGIVFAMLVPVTAVAETELSFSVGVLGTPASRVEGSDPGGAGSFSFLSGWGGGSLEMPSSYGVRGTWWTAQNPSLGFGLDFSHNRIGPDSATATANGFNRLEFSGGMNTVTANVWYRWPGALGGGAVTPYVGAGAGVALPNVDIDSAGGSTSGVQLTGVAVEAVAGLKYNFNDRWAVYGEYKGGYTSNDIDLDNGGSLSTGIVTNAINFGVSFSF